jgi:hypothetical protein
MQNLKDECEEAWAWLSKIPVECWEIHVMDTNCKTDLVVNNPSEVFNKIILDVRGIPIKTVIEGMRTKHLVTNEGKKIGFSYSRWYINPTYCEMLEENKKWSRNYKSMQYVENLWQVSRGNESIYVVNLEARTCGCRRWDVSGIPCNHAIFFVYKYDHLISLKEIYFASEGVCCYFGLGTCVFIKICCIFLFSNILMVIEFLVNSFPRVFAST